MSALRLLLICCAFGQATFAEMPRPSERSSPLPGEEWIPQPRPGSWSLGGERPLPEVPLQLDELRLHRPLFSRLAVQAGAASLRAPDIRMWQVETGCEFYAPQLRVAVRFQRAGWSAGEFRGRLSPQPEVAFAIGDGNWRVAWREYGDSGRRQNQVALQLRGRALHWAAARASSPYGSDPIWEFGVEMPLSDRLRLGGRLRDDTGELHCAVRTGSLRVGLNVAASGLLRGGVAWSVEWMR